MDLDRKATKLFNEKVLTIDDYGTFWTFQDVKDPDKFYLVLSYSSLKALAISIDLVKEYNLRPSSETVS
jgi:hypothetical protein